MTMFSIYLHIPFCQKRCSYCDFNTTAGMEAWMGAYTQSLCKEIRLVAEAAGSRLPVHTVYFGGGTPSLLPVKEMKAIFQALAESFELQSDCEVSLEANPGTVSLPYLQGLRSLGINRLSFGMQSALPEELRLLGRLHTHLDVIRAVKWARQAGFENLNLDLIYGLPQQSLQNWQVTLERALDLQPEHLSLYSLTVEEGTPLHRWAKRGLLAWPDDDLAAEQYEWASLRLERANYVGYEISNWARPNQTGGFLACRHNLQYWRNLPYFGFGVGAHGYIHGKRLANVAGLLEYIQRCQDAQSAPDFPLSPAIDQMVSIDRQTEMQETMMVGLRLTQEGVSRRAFQERFGLALEEVFNQQIEVLVKMGLLEWAGLNRDHLRLTRRGRLLGNQVFLHFVGD